MYHAGLGDNVCLAWFRVTLLQALFGVWAGLCYSGHLPMYNLSLHRMQYYCIVAGSTCAWRGFGLAIWTAVPALLCPPRLTSDHIRVCTQSLMFV